MSCTGLPATGTSLWTGEGAPGGRGAPHCVLGWEFGLKMHFIHTHTHTHKMHSVWFL